MPMTVDQSVPSISQRLSKAQPPLRGGEVPDWDREAGLLLRRAEQDPGVAVEDLLEDRLAGVPLGYLVGTEEFLGDEFEVEPGTVIPHPATELLAELAIRALDMHGAPPRPASMLEVGVGVGVVSISVLKRRPAIQAHASELSGAALRLTRQNARRILPDTDRLHLYQGYFTDDIFSAFKRGGLRDIRLVVSNPPYLVEGDEVSDATKKSGLAHLSYTPDNDPSWFLRCIAAAPEGMLGADCSVLMECAEWYLPDHDSVMRAAGWQTEIFDREEYSECFGSSPQMRPMQPTPHRVLHAWRGAAEGLGGLELDME